LDVSHYKAAYQARQLALGPARELNNGTAQYAPGKRHKRGVLGTIGILEVVGEHATGRIIDLEELSINRSS
jgi:hypothetical protein